MSLSLMFLLLHLREIVALSNWINNAFDYGRTRMDLNVLELQLASGIWGNLRDVQAARDEPQSVIML
jgi:hypothetical protein